MEPRRRHRSELFICFTSRASSSSSIRISTKPVPSPGRAEPSSSLPSSMSTRFRTNGSMKSSHPSPIFPPSGKKIRGSSFENHSEPSSPKVTCIGQVRVKTKKQTNIIRTRSIHSARSSFRRLELEGNQTPYQIQQQHRNQKWIHFPLSICEALRTIGSDLNCFSSCGKQERIAESRHRRASSCRSVLARLFFALQEEPERERNVEEDDTRLEVSVPPKNALLLMRCRSDPMRTSALASRLLESSDEGSNQDEHEEHHLEEISKYDEDQTSGIDLLEACDSRDQENNADLAVTDLHVDSNLHEVDEVSPDQEHNAGQVEVTDSGLEKVDEISDMRDEENNDLANTDLNQPDITDPNLEREDEQEPNGEREQLLAAVQTEEKEVNLKDEEEKEACERSCSVEREDVAEGRGRFAGELPECLVLMIREPKLSMEVSKETWLCGADFIRLLPDRRCRRRSTDSGDAPAKESVAPARSSCSFPVVPSIAFSGESIAAMIEQKFANAMAYEPYILTRCKSEPMKNSGKLSPDACFWKGRKVAGLRVPATGVSVPATGLSF